MAESTSGSDFLDLSGGAFIDALEGDDTIIGTRGDDRLIGKQGNDVLYGNLDNDRLDGTENDDRIYGGAGDDTIEGGSDKDKLYGDTTNKGPDILSQGFGNDVIFGGSGDDELYGNQGDDILDGETGNDIVRGGQGNDKVQGDGGDDQLFGDRGKDQLFCGIGNDTGSGGEGSDEIFGQDGDDVLDGNTGRDRIEGGAGKDLLRGDLPGDVTTDFGDRLPSLSLNLTVALDNEDIILGGEGEDTAFGGQGNDQLFGNEDKDLLYGNLGNDLIYGGMGDDTAWGGQNDDLIFGDLGSDIVYGDIGNDSIYGGSLASEDDNSGNLLFGNAGNDYIIGNLGADTIYGGQDNDNLRGGKGNDLLFGDKGNDFLCGDQGLNTLIGGEGSDRFCIVQGTGSLFQPNADFIDDFVNGQDFLELVGNQTFENLNIVQGVGENAGNTIILDKLTGQPLAVLRGINVSAIDRSDFLPPATPAPVAPAPVAPEQPLPPLPQLPPLTPSSGGGTTTPTPGSIEFVAPTFNINEDGTVVGAQVTVRRVNGSDGAVTADVTAVAASTNPADPGTSTTGDYDNTVFPITVSFASGDTAAKTIQIPIVADTVGEPTENLLLQLGNLTGGASIGDIPTATLQILDDDMPGALEFVNATYSADENNPSVTVEVRRTGSNTGAVSVDVEVDPAAATANLAAVLGTDFNFTKATVTFNTGELGPKQVTIPLLDDQVADGPKDIALKLSNPTAGAKLNAQATAIVNLVDDDIPVVTISNTTESQSTPPTPPTTVKEDGSTPTQSFIITVDTPAPAGGLVVNLEIATGTGTATINQDYTLSSPTAGVTLNTTGNPPSITIPEGATTANIDVVITAANNDQQPEGPEVVTLNLKPNGTLYGLGTPARSTIEIEDDDLPTFSVTASVAQTAENTPGTPATFTIAPNGPIIAPITVNFDVEGSATSGTDFLLNPTGSVTFNPGDVNKIVSVSPLQDTQAESSETVALVLQSGTGYSVGTNNKRATVKILDDEPSQVYISGGGRVEEADLTAKKSFTIFRIGGSANATTINYQIDTKVTNAADPGVDYDTSGLTGYNSTTQTGTITLGVGVDEVTFPIAPFNDPTGGEPQTESIALKLLPSNNSSYTLALDTANIFLINNG